MPLSEVANIEKEGTNVMFMMDDLKKKSFGISIKKRRKKAAKKWRIEKRGLLAWENLTPLFPE